MAAEASAMGAPFQPTDVELVDYHLRKVQQLSMQAEHIEEIKINEYEPWELANNQEHFEHIVLGLIPSSPKFYLFYVLSCNLQTCLGCGKIDGIFFST